MDKKTIAIGILMFMVISIAAYSTFTINDLKNSQGDLKKQINSLNSEKQQLQNDLDKTKQAEPPKVNKPEPPKGSIQLGNVEIQSKDIYSEGVVKGAIYGTFNVATTVRNISEFDVPNLKVACIFLKSNPSATGDVNNEMKVERIEKLLPGEEKGITFTGLKVDHPEVNQEIIVSIINPSISDINDNSNIRLINLKTAFPPGSNE